MKPLAIPLLALAACLPGGPLCASPSDTHRDDSTLPVLREDRTGPNYVDVMNQAAQAVADAKKRSGEQRAAAEIARTAEQTVPSKPWTFIQASAEFKDEPGQIVTVSAGDIQSIRGLWVLSESVSDGRDVPAPSLNTIEFAPGGFRLPSDSSWRRYEGGIDAEMLLEHRVITAPAMSREDIHVTRCGKPVAKNTMVCRTQSTREVYDLSHPPPNLGKVVGRVTTFGKYTRQ